MVNSILPEPPANGMSFRSDAYRRSSAFIGGYVFVSRRMERRHFVVQHTGNGELDLAGASGKRDVFQIGSLSAFICVHRRLCICFTPNGAPPLRSPAHWEW